MFRFLLAIPLLIALSLTAACGDDEQVDPTATPPAGTATSAPADATPTPPADTPTAAPGGFVGDTAPVTITPVPDPPIGASLLEDVRVGRHDEEGGFDRIVFEFDSSLPPGTIEYVDEASHCGSGEPVDDLAGDAILKIAFTSTNAHNEQGQLTIDATQIDGPGGSILESRQICDFEGHVTWVLGTGGEKPIRVQVLTGPPRVVVDVQH